jgi:uncharacterized oxidoreductase
LFTPNPVAAGWPSPGGPVMLDVSMSITTNAMTARRRGEGTRFPHPALLDAEGRPTDDPNAFFTDPGGTLLPLGGSQGHKGFGLSFMIETFAGILTGLGFGVNPGGRHNDGTLMICLNPAAFQPLEKFKAEVAALARYVKETPRAAGVEEIYYPGELEFLTERKRRREGIPIEEQTWANLVKTAEKLGIAELVA